MRNVLIAVCFIAAAICCVPAAAQCPGGSCAMPGRVVARTVNAFRSTTARPFRRGWFVRR